MLAKAILAVAPKKVALRDVEIGSVGEWDIKVELEVSAISAGTESYALSSTHSHPGPFVLGYAPVGRVTEVGDRAAALFQIGDRASYFQPRAPIDVGQSCGGHQSPAIFCVDPQGRDPEGSNCYCVRVPAALSSERAAFGGISAVACLGVSLANQNVGDKALVVGQGMIGQFAAQHLKLRGAEVAVVDRFEKRLSLSKESGADYTIDAGSLDMVEAVRSIWPEGADIVVDTTGSYRAIEASLDVVRWRGKYVFLGWCKGKDFNLEKMHNRVFEAYFPWTLEGRRVLSSWRLMQTEVLKVDHLNTHCFKAGDAQQAYDLIFNAPEQFAGVSLEWRDGKQS